MANASYLAYPPVVAGGNNCTTIHYINNSQIVNDGQLVLMDAGCEYGGYTSDITRTWPINRSFTEPQRVLYELVLNLQQDMFGRFYRILIYLLYKPNFCFRLPFKGFWKYIGHPLRYYVHSTWKIFARNRFSIEKPNGCRTCTKCI